MTRLRHEAHARMLGNGLCTRPVELDCRMESVCETCAYFATGPEFVPVLLRQRDHARDHHQTDRAALFDTLIERAENTLLTAITRITPVMRRSERRRPARSRTCVSWTRPRELAQGALAWTVTFLILPVKVNGGS